ncbi:MAG: hypothetical protein AAF642_07310 [Pseudomonadota bacterium]
MTPSRTPLSDGLIYFLVGPDLSDAIIGDLQEQARATSAPHWALTLGVFRSLPGLVWIGFGNISAQRFRIEFGWLAALLSVAWAWELQISQVFAWPIASNLTAVSPFSVVFTCKLAYLALFSLGLFILMGSWRLLNRSRQVSWRLRTQRFGATCLAGLVPILYLLSFPGPHDGHPAFRYIQLLLVGVIGVAVLVLSRRNASEMGHYARS